METRLLKKDYIIVVKVRERLNKASSSGNKNKDE